jgi:shikimate kinase
MNYDGQSKLYLLQPIVLIGMMGSGKTTLGNRLARSLGVEFRDSDEEIQAAANVASTADIYDQWGADAFRSIEYDVIKKFLTSHYNVQCVLSTGEGAFLNEDVRDLIQRHAVSIWLKSDLETLYQRVSRRASHPGFDLPKDDPDALRHALEKLAKEREPIYQLADICVESNDGTHPDTVRRLKTTLRERGIAVFA